MPLYWGAKVTEDCCRGKAPLQTQHSELQPRQLDMKYCLEGPGQLLPYQDMIKDVRARSCEEVPNTSSAHSLSSAIIPDPYEMWFPNAAIL